MESSAPAITAVGYVILGSLRYRRVRSACNEPYRFAGWPVKSAQSVVDPKPTFAPDSAPNKPFINLAPNVGAKKS
jgi:hypothetical protein